MATIRQQIFSFLTINPNSVTSEVAAHIGKSDLYTVKAMNNMKTFGMLFSDKVQGEKNHTWRVSNRAVKFNTGESVLQAAKRKPKANSMAVIRFEISELKAMIAKLEKTLA
jgi:hypothetical protein